MAWCILQQAIIWTNDNSVHTMAMYRGLGDLCRQIIRWHWHWHVTCIEGNMYWSLKNALSNMIFIIYQTASMFLLYSACATSAWQLMTVNRLYRMAMLITHAWCLVQTGNCIEQHGVEITCAAKCRIELPIAFSNLLYSYICKVWSGQVILFWHFMMDRYDHLYMLRVHFPIGTVCNKSV